MLLNSYSKLAVDTVQKNFLGDHSYVFDVDFRFLFALYFQGNLRV